MEPLEKQLEKLKTLSIFRMQLRIKINDLRRKKSKIEGEIENLINQISNAD